MRLQLAVDQPVAPKISTLLSVFEPSHPPAATRLPSTAVRLCAHLPTWRLGAGSQSGCPSTVEKQSFLTSYPPQENSLDSNTAARDPCRSLLVGRGLYCGLS